MVSRFRRLDHQRAGDRPAHGRRVEAAIDQALGDVVDGDAGAVDQRTRVDDAFMRDAAGFRLVEHVVGALQPGGDIVGVEDRHLGRLRQAFAAHHQAVAPGDRQDRGRAEGCGRDRAGAAVRFRMTGQVRRQMRLDADRAHAGTAAAMRDAEGLVQVEVADVGADVTGAGQADHGVHVGAVEIDLAAVLMDDIADLPDRLLEDAVRRRDR